MVSQGDQQGIGDAGGGQVARQRVPIGGPDDLPVAEVGQVARDRRGVLDIEAVADLQPAGVAADPHHGPVATVHLQDVHEPGAELLPDEVEELAQRRVVALRGRHGGREPRDERQASSLRHRGHVSSVGQHHDRGGPQEQQPGCRLMGQEHHLGDGESCHTAGEHQRHGERAQRHRPRRRSVDPGEDP